MTDNSIPGIEVPASLSELDQWLLWRLETVDNRPAKVPYSVHGHRASSTDPRDWASFDEARELLSQDANRFSGLGLVFTNATRMVGIDIDDCLENGEVKSWARGIVERFCDTYMERSPAARASRYGRWEVCRQILGEYRLEMAKLRCTIMPATSP